MNHFRSYLLLPFLCAACHSPDIGEDAAPPTHDSGPFDAGTLDSAAELDGSPPQDKDARTIEPEVDGGVPPPLEVDAGLQSDQVTTAEGDLLGYVHEDTVVFLGIPYAAPPFGRLRFAPPKAAKPWRGTKVANESGASCIQALDNPVLGDRPQSEDCLTVNVFAPRHRVADGAPVMVFFHGGAFSTGGGAPYYARWLSEAGNVVVVTLNYRLGVLGFMAHPAIDAELDVPSGNLGIRDQQLALTWVQRNIGSFGGDPGNVTIFGQSAGSLSVFTHLIAKGSEGLFHRAIMQSAAGAYGPYAPYPRDRIVNSSITVAHKVCPEAADVLRCLRGADPHALVEAASEFVPGVTTEFWPHVDGHLIPKDPGKLFREGRFQRVPIILGSTRDEVAYWEVLGIPSPRSIPEFQYFTVGLHGNHAVDALAHYVPSSDADAHDTWIRMATDHIFRCPSRELARTASAFTPVYLYSFDVPPAGHTQDLDYVFGWPGGGASLTFTPPAPIDEPTVHAVQAYWSRFAHSGNPNGPDLPAWPAYSVETDPHMVLANPLRAGTGLSRADCDFWDSLYVPHEAPSP